MILGVAGHLLTWRMVRSATLQDIADHLGVHRSTVALALRDHPRISLETRQKVQATAKALGYHVNPLVAALMRSRRSGNPVRHETLAFVTNYSTRYGWRPQHHDRPDFFPGAAKRAEELGYRLEDFWLAEPGMTPKRFRDILLTRNIHGLIVGRMPPGINTLDLSWDGFSVVALGMTLRSPQFHHITENHFDTAIQCMEQCAAHGYRRIGFVFSEANDSPRVGERWLGAYLQYQNTAGNLDSVPICPGVPTHRDAFLEWFRREQPDALMVTHSSPVLKWLASIGCEVPGDVALVELQDNPNLGAAGVYYDPAKIGAVAVETLVGLMYRNETGVPTEPSQVMLNGRWRAGYTLPAKMRPALLGRESAESVTTA